MTDSLALVPALDTMEEAGLLTLTRLRLDLLPRPLTYDQYRELGEKLGEIKRGSSWWIGDWLIYGEDTYGDKFAQAVHATGLSEETLKYYLWVCKSIPPSRRLARVSFSIHALVASLTPDEQKRWLSIAVQEKLSQRDLRARMRDEKALLDAEDARRAVGRSKAAERRQEGVPAEEEDLAPIIVPPIERTARGLPTAYVVPGPICRRLINEATAPRNGHVRVPADLIERLKPIVES